MTQDFKTSEKSPDIESAISNLFGINRRQMIELGRCVSCNNKDLTTESFKDDVSLREYEISGLCQECQDKVFWE